ncbi:D-inositol-3-phosphate glycosyltransferase [uncultured archaeon]|nr:D-inositol-3-phosphate glycosyltransferase [uncultured archaeon]
MKILAISPFSTAGASTSRVYNLLKNLDDEVLLVLPYEDRYGVSSTEKWFYFPLQKKSFGNILSWWLRTMKKMREFRPDIIHVLKPHLFTLPPALAYKTFFGGKIVFDCDEWDPDTLSDNKENWLKIQLTTFLAKAAMALSDSILYSNRLILEEKIPARYHKKCVYLTNGVNTREFKPRIIRHSRFTFLYMGMLKKIDHILPLVDAAAALKKDLPNAKCVIVGGGEKEEELKRIVEEKGLAKIFEFKGMQPHQKLPQIIAETDALVIPFMNLPGIRYQSNVKLFEYMASGKPIVATDVGEIKHILDGAGYVVTVGKPDEMAQTLKKIYEDPEHAAKRAYAARKLAEEKYDWKTLSKKLKETYQKTTKK